MTTLNLYDGVSAPFTFENLKGFQSYLNEVWQNRPLFFAEDEDEEERRETTQRFFIFNEGNIKPRNYVGFIQYENLRINVYPRVFNRPDFSDGSLAIQNLLKWLSYSQRIHFPFTDTSLTTSQTDDWLEAFIYLFGNFTEETLSQSPYMAYEEVTEEMNFLRGRIAMPQYISKSLSKGRHHTIHCTYEPFIYDNLFNRIVKHTCRLLLSVSKNRTNKEILNNILFLLDDVSDMYCSATDCEKVKVNRLYREIGTINSMCSVFLQHRTYHDHQNGNNNLCMLLPMEVIFEQYIAGFLQKHFPELHSIAQASGEYLAKTGFELTENVFQMQHDILLPGKLIIDTKYKFRQQSNDKKGGVSQNDIYQMISYCYRRNINEGLLLYPFNYEAQACNETNQFRISSAVSDIKIQAKSIDITEAHFENFEQLQKKKLLEVLL